MSISRKIKTVGKYLTLLNKATLSLFVDCGTSYHNIQNNNRKKNFQLRYHSTITIYLGSKFQITTKKPEQIMAEELKEAAIRGDVEFLRNCVASNKPIEYYLTLFPMIQPGDRLFGNIFHFENREDFIRGAIRTLPLHVSQQLLLQQRDEDMFNPLHKAAAIGNLDKIKMFLELFSVHVSSSLSLSSSSFYGKKPWLQKTNKGYTPCHVALVNDQEECGLEILGMDMELLCNIDEEDDECDSLLCISVKSGLNNFALKMLRSPFSLSCSGFNGYTPLHYVPRCSGMLHLL